MSALETMLTLRPLLLRRMLLILFAGPILIVAMATDGFGANRFRVEDLCFCFEAAWFDRAVRLPA